VPRGVRRCRAEPACSVFVAAAFTTCEALAPHVLAADDASDVLLGDLQLVDGLLSSRLRICTGRGGPRATAPRSQ